MYRLVFCNDREDETPDVKYIQRVASSTIAEGLRFTFGNMEDGDFLFQAIMGGFQADNFFNGLAQYVSMTDDDLAGRELVRCKVRRMIEKVEDSCEEYTFDVFEELLFYEAIMHCKEHFRFAKEVEKTFSCKEKEKQIAGKLVEDFHYEKKDAGKISRAISRFHQMGLKTNRDENLFFWDRDFEIVFCKGFIEGIRFLKSMAGESLGYGYDYASEIFTDIGMKAPLLLLGTREASRIANEMSRMKTIDLLAGLKPQSREDKWMEVDPNEEDLPFN